MCDVDRKDRERSGDGYAHGRIHARSARQLTLGSEFFLNLRREVVIARKLDRWIYR